MRSSETSFDPASTMLTAWRVPTTTRSIVDSSRSFFVGLKTKRSAMRATRTAPSTSVNGIGLSARAAAVPLIARMSGSFSPSAERTRATICVSKA